MKSRKLMYLTILIICVFLLMGLGLKGSISGYLLLIPPGGESTYTSQDSWPCDTTSNPVMSICLFEETEGLIDCIEEDFDDIPEEVLTNQVPDTITIYFSDLPPGNYYLGVYCKELGAELADYGNIVTWYHPQLDSLGIIQKKEDSQEISITKSHPNVELGAIIIQQ